MRKTSPSKHYIGGKLRVRYKIYNPTLSFGLDLLIFSNKLVDILVAEALGALGTNFKLL